MQYEELDLYEHTLKRPDTYIGSIREIVRSEYIETENHFEKKEITYIPAIYRLIIEALSNATDNVVRSKENNIVCKYIKVNIDKDTGLTSVCNDGMCIPTTMKNDVYIPEMLFGRLLTSSNYNDEETRYTSGRNGLGISLTNIFSTWFQVDLVDDVNKYSYVQEWSNNMKTKGQPKIRKSSKKGYTKVSWIPDFSYFGVEGYTDDFISMVKKYVVDLCIITGLNVYFNDVKIPIRNFKNYVQFYTTEKEVIHIEYKTDKSDFNVAVFPSQEYNQVSFVNGIYTREGGVHVDGWVDGLLKEITNRINTKHKCKLTIKDIKKYFTFIVLCNLPNPEFTSQSKDKLSCPKTNILIEEKYYKQIMKWKFLQEVLKHKELQNIKKVEGKREKLVESYDRANKAGSKESHLCTLILCEGLSAKTFSVKGITRDRTGRDYYGILPLTGKLKNVRDNNISAILSNTVIINIIQIIGLQHGTDYTIEKNYHNLNYGKVLLLCDSDVDGYHIQGLILNMFEYMFPSILKRNDFIAFMRTPVLKVISNKDCIRFYDSTEATNYIKDNNIKKEQIKYYKGLGTSNDQDIQVVFGKHIVVFTDNDCKECMDLIFGEKNADYRKKWISEYKDTELTIDNDRMNITDYINHEVIKFSIDDCKRSLPCVVDGLKESQRKILYSCFLKNLTSKPIKVAQLAGFVAEQTNYHHGEVCLFDTIIGMNQTFVGANNIPLLKQDGQFGTRLMNGKDAANGRYIFTSLSDAIQYIIKEEDKHVLNYTESEGKTIEPDFYVPIVPILLINGSKGIGTGWSTDIPQYNPKDIIQWIRQWIEKVDDKVELHPWYKGFQGDIVQIIDTKHARAKKYESRGIFKRNKNKIILSLIHI